MYTLGFDPMSSKSQGSNLMSHQGLPANCKNIIKRFFLVKGRTHYWGKPQGKPQEEGESKRMGNGVEWIMKFEPMHHCCMSQFHQLSWHKILEEYLIRKKMLHLFLKKTTIYVIVCSTKHITIKSIPKAYWPEHLNWEKASQALTTRIAPQPQPQAHSPTLLIYSSNLLMCIDK